LCVGAFALVASFSTLVSTADALIEPVVEQNIGTVVEHSARGGATTIPGVSCGTTCTDWWLEEHRPIPNQPSSAQLHQELRSFRSGVGLNPALRALGTIGLAAGVFDLGWKIGDGINAKFLNIGIPEQVTDPGSATWVQLTFRAANSRWYYGATWPSVDGWVGTFRYNGDTNDRWFAPPCPFSGFMPPSPLTVGNEAADPIAQCIYYENGVKKKSPVTVQWAEVPENGLAALGPIDDYSGQPYDRQTLTWSGKPTTQSQLEDRVRSALESGNYPMAEAWWAHQLDPVNYPDPTATENEDHRCDLSRPAYKNPGGSVDPSPHSLKVAAPFPTSGRPSGAYGAPDPYLRWGETKWAGSYIDNWSGWGWRHIQAKHGWSAADEAATREALLTPAFTVEQTGTSMRYYGANYEQNGVVCRRRVVVEYGVYDGDPEGSPKGIITSYAEVVP
jgi:hypothetical protein